MKNEEAILEGAFAKALLDKSRYEAQIDDILKISISNIYQSQEVVEKEIAGYEILSTLLDKRCKVITNAPTHYDTLVLKLFEDSDREEMSLYQELMNICNYVSVMTDSKSLRIFQKLKGLNVR